MWSVRYIYLIIQLDLWSDLSPITKVRYIIFAIIEKCNSNNDCSNDKFCKKNSPDDQSICERKIGRIMKRSRRQKYYCIVRNVIVFFFWYLLQTVAHAAKKLKLNQRIRIQWLWESPDPMNAMLIFMEEMSTKRTAMNCTFTGCMEMFQNWL